MAELRPYEAPAGASGAAEAAAEAEAAAAEAAEAADEAAADALRALRLAFMACLIARLLDLFILRPLFLLCCLRDLAIFIYILQKIK